MSFRNANIDKPKTGKLLLKARKTRCSVEGCDKILTLFEGPGHDKYCRQHQKDLVEYGGLAKGTKEHSFSRGDCCEECGFDPLQHPTVKKVKDPIVVNRLVRTLLDVDHIDGNHFNNDPNNHKTLCKVCHAIKTTLNEDFLGKSA
jgi:hypothetical protein